MRRAFQFVVLGCLIVFAGHTMAGIFDFLKRYDVHLSPDVRGQVLLDGAPMTGLPVFRELHFDGKRYLDKTRTDQSGRFYFTEKNISSRAPGRLFDEVRNVQVITVDHGGKTYLLWHTATDNIGRSKTLEEKLQGLNCDLSNEEVTHHFTIFENPDFEHHIGSICRWPE